VIVSKNQETNVWVDRFIAQYCRWLGAAMVICLALMVALVFGNVVLRYGFNSGFTISEELSRWLFVWMTFMGAVVALHERGHLGTDFLTARLSQRGKAFCLGAAQLLMLYCCYLIFSGAWEQTKINLKATSAVMEASMAIFYATGLLFAVLGGLVLVLDFWRLASGRTTGAELSAVQTSEDRAHETH
jgi:TRAP-type transport system small permease protein